MQTKATVTLKRLLDLVIKVVRFIYIYTIAKMSSVLDKNTFNRKAQLELASDNEPTEPEDSPVEEKPVGRHLKRSNAIALITIPSQAGKVTQNEASEQEDDNGSKPAHESGADWEMVEHGIDGNDDETPKANKRLTKPKPRESIKAAGRHKVLESDLEDNMEVSTTFL
jgi:hypothetical protein